MDKQYIRRTDGFILGYVDTSGTKKTARLTSGRIVGTYDSTDNKTREFNGRIYAIGDALVGLIYENQ